MTTLKKPVTRKVLADTSHGISDELVVTIYPNATIGIREPRRQDEVRLDIATLYESALINEVRKRSAN